MPSISIHLFDQISRQLDALSHFHFTPKPVVAEVNISTLPVSSLLLEEVAPSLSFTSTAQSLVAPEEVSQKKRGKAASLMSDSELTSLDKQRIRRAAKAHKKANKSDSNSLQQSGTKKGGKFVDHALDDQLKRDSRVIMTNSDGSLSKKARVEHGLHEADANSSISYGKSSSFFSNLQEQTKQQIKSTIEGTTVSAKSSKDAKKLSSSSRSLKL
jgi:U3 small nucleolar ribonucleoprotein component